MADLLTKLDRLPPIICRGLARENGRALSTKELANRSGLDESWINTLSHRTSWAKVKIETADRFLAACGVNPFRLKRSLEYLRRQRHAKRGFRHTWKRPGYFRRLLKAAK